MFKKIPESPEAPPLRQNTRSGGLFKKILLVLAVVIALFVVVVSTRPSDFRVERTRIIATPPGRIFPHVNDLHLWQAWSPWAKLDPNARNTFDGPPTGKGASMHWTGDSNVGEGTMTIIESKPDQQVRFRLDFKKPFEGTNLAEFNLTPEGTSTRVSWSMTGKCNFITKAIGLFVSMDQMIGDQFGKGLDDLAKVAEAGKK